MAQDTLHIFLVGVSHKILPWPPVYTHEHIDTQEANSNSTTKGPFITSREKTLCSSAPSIAPPWGSLNNIRFENSVQLWLSMSQL